MRFRRQIRKCFGPSALLATSTTVLVIYFAVYSGEERRPTIPKEITKRPVQEFTSQTSRQAESQDGKQFSDTSQADNSLHHDDVISATTNHNVDYVIHAKRVGHLRKGCEAVTTGMGRKMVPYTPRSDFPLRKEIEKDYFVSSRHHLVYCAIQKVGSSFWKRAFRVLNDMAPPGSLFSQSGIASHTNNEPITFQNRSAQWQQSTLKTSLKFLFVRDPFSRVFSAYMDKLFLPHRASAVRISNERPDRPISNISYHKGQTLNTKPQCHLETLTFAQFIHRLGSYMKDDHYLPMHSHCDPCSGSFDIVGKMETFRQDAEYILGKAGATMSDVAADSLTFDARSDLNIMSDVALRTLVTPAWSKLQDPSCGPARDELLRRMWTVFKVRGLLSAEVSFPLTPAQSANATLPDLLLAIKNGYDASGDRQQRLQQRDAAMMEAFRSVSRDDLEKVQALYKVDCVLFDYDCSLDKFLGGQNNASLNDIFDWQ